MFRWDRCDHRRPAGAAHKVTMRYPCVMDVREFASVRGVSERRVRALIANGSIPAAKVGRSWEIDTVFAGKPALSRRPLSEESRKALSIAIQRRSIDSLEGQLRARTAKRLRALREAEDPAALLAEWWGNAAPTIVDAASSMVVRAIAGDHDSVRKQIRRRPTRYLRRPEDLAAAVLTERTIRGLSIQALATKADLAPRQVRRIERADPDSVRSMRSVLRVLDLEPTALPTPRGAR